MVVLLRARFCQQIVYKLLTIFRLSTNNTLDHPPVRLRFEKRLASLEGLLEVFEMALVQLLEILAAAEQTTLEIMLSR